jgi:hypothetical protein
MSGSGSGEAAKPRRRRTRGSVTKAAQQGKATPDS